MSAGDSFLNAAAMIETELSPEPLLDRLQQVEGQLGRTRDIRWGPRTIDLDLLLYEDVVLHNDRLDVPHPGCLYRRFVLDPLAEIAGDWRHPETGLTVGEMRSQLLRRPLPVAVTGGTPTTSWRATAEIGRQFPDVQVVAWDSCVAHAGQAPVSWPSPRQAGGDEAKGAVAVPACFINLDAPGLDDVSLALSIVQAMTDVPIVAGGVPCL